MNKITAIMLIIIVFFLIIYGLKRMNIPLMPLIILGVFSVFIWYINKTA